MRRLRRQIKFHTRLDETNFSSSFCFLYHSRACHNQEILLALQLSFTTLSNLEQVGRLHSMVDSTCCWNAKSQANEVCASESVSLCI